MTLETQLLDFTTSDKETLHGLLFSPRERKSDLALLLVHGVAMNFYLPPLPSLNFSRIEKNKAALYGIKAVSPNSYAKGEERPYGNRVYNRTDGISAIGAARSDRKI